MADYFSKRLVLAPLNVNVSRLNELCCDYLPGAYHISHSVDAMANEEDGMDSGEAIPEQVLNTFTLPSFPL